MNKPIDISTVVLKTHRLTLRSWRQTDLEDFYEYARVDGVGQMAGWLPHQSIEESKKILASFITEKKTPPTVFAMYAAKKWLPAVFLSPNTQARTRHLPSPPRICMS